MAGTGLVFANEQLEVSKCGEGRVRAHIFVVKLFEFETSALAHCMLHDSGILLTVFLDVRIRALTIIGSFGCLAGWDFPLLFENYSA